MEKELSDKLIAGAAKMLFTYCRGRTRLKEEAEDLSQDIMLALLKSRESLLDDRAFYGFMWAVARNVYRDWCKKRVKAVAEVALDEHVPDSHASVPELLEKDANLRVLYRELSLLTLQYRRVTVLYYFDSLAVADISKSLGISESMVKFLLFKSRKILKEGMNMERVSGNLSYNPGSLQLRFWGTGRNPFWKLCKDNLIAQNILLACCNDRCTAEEISLQMGVSVAYLEHDLNILCENGVLTRKNGKYETAVVIFTEAFSVEADEKTRALQGEAAALIEQFLREKFADIKAIGFYRGDETHNLFLWHIAAIILEKAVLDRCRERLNVVFPTRHMGCEAFVWGEEVYSARYGSFGTCGLTNAGGDLLQFLDFSINGEMDHHYFFNYPGRVNALLFIAKGEAAAFSENDMLEVSELVKRGFVVKLEEGLRLTFPVFTGEEFEKLLALLEPVISSVAEKTREMADIATDVLIQHVPVAMKKEAAHMGFLKMFDTAVSNITGLMLDNGTLRAVSDAAHPTAYVVLR